MDNGAPSRPSRLRTQLRIVRAALGGRLTRRRPASDGGNPADAAAPMLDAIWQATSPTYYPRLIIVSDDFRQNQCQMCLARTAPGDLMACLPCGHLFHEGCAHHPLRAPSTCPLCQAPYGVLSRKQHVRRFSR